MHVKTAGMRLNFILQNPAIKRGARFVQDLSMESPVATAHADFKASTSGFVSGKMNPSFMRLLSGSSIQAGNRQILLNCVLVLTITGQNKDVISIGGS
jgi:hypothetical protein